MPGFFGACLYVMGLIAAVGLGSGIVVVAAYAAAVIWPVLVLVMLPHALIGIVSWLR